MTVVCGWCGQVLAQGQPGEPVSHGMCEACRRRAQEELQSESSLTFFRGTTENRVPEPNADGILWLALGQEAARTYGDEYWHKGPSWFLWTIKLDRSANLVHLADLSHPTVRRIKDSVSLRRTSTWGPINDQDWPRWADFGILEAYPWVVEALVADGIDGVFVRDANQQLRHTSLALLNQDMIVSATAEERPRVKRNMDESLRRLEREAVAGGPEEKVVYARARQRAGMIVEPWELYPASYVLLEAWKNKSRVEIEWHIHVEGSRSRSLGYFTTHRHGDFKGYVTTAPVPYVITDYSRLHGGLPAEGRSHLEELSRLIANGAVRAEVTEPIPEQAYPDMISSGVSEAEWQNEWVPWLKATSQRVLRLNTSKQEVFGPYGQAHRADFGWNVVYPETIRSIRVLKTRSRSGRRSR